MSGKIKRLSLDLEGVLIVTDDPLVPGKYLPRPHADEFITAAEKLFDHIHLNTCSFEYIARPILKELFGLDEKRWERGGKWDYHNWRSMSEPYGKMNGFEKYRGDTLIHIEDSFEKDATKLDHAEARRCHELRFHYLTISPWHYELAVSPKADYDQELPKMIDRMKKILATAS